MDKEERQRRFERKQSHKDHDRENSDRRHMEQLDRNDSFAHRDEDEQLDRDDFLAHRDADYKIEKGARLDELRQKIREKGFMSAAELAVELGEMRTIGVLKGWSGDIHEILQSLPCEDIHTVEYANWETHVYRRKDLFYFLP